VPLHARPQLSYSSGTMADAILEHGFHLGKRQPVPAWDEQLIVAESSGTPRIGCYCPINDSTANDALRLPWDKGNDPAHEARWRQCHVPVKKKPDKRGPLTQIPVCESGGAYSGNVSQLRKLETGVISKDHVVVVTTGSLHGTPCQRLAVCILIVGRTTLDGAGVFQILQTESAVQEAEDVRDLILLVAVGGKQQQLQTSATSTVLA